MEIVVAVDSFKGSMTSLEAGDAIKNGVLNVDPHSNVRIFPLADGGEGTTEALTSGLGGYFANATVTGPLGELVNAKYGIIDRNGQPKVAIIEMASAAGITLVPKDKRNPLYTTTYGVGELITDAIKKGCRHFVIGIGGSATNDGGLGMLQALGYDFVDIDGKSVGLGAISLRNIKEIHTNNVSNVLQKCSFRIACDVQNPLCGENGCSAIFGPQKGANRKMIEDMDTWLLKFAELSKHVNPEADVNFPGSGAAGGLGFAFRTYLGGTLEPGIRIIIDETGLEGEIANADIVVTGEGCLDEQTVMGKAPIGVAKLAKKYNKKVIAFAGSVKDGASVCNDCGIDAFFPILRNVVSLEEAMAINIARSNLEKTVEQVFRLLETK